MLKHGLTRAAEHVPGSILKRLWLGSVNLKLRNNFDATNLRGRTVFPQHSLGVMEVETLVRKKD